MSAVRRATLACYPRWWRAQHGEEVIGLLLDSAEDNGRADYRDLLNLAVHGVLLRLKPDSRALPGRSVRSVRDRVSVIAVALLVPISLTLLVFGEWAPWDPSTSFDPAPVANLTTGVLCYLAGLLAAGFVACGRATAGRRLAAAGGLIALVIQFGPIEQFALRYSISRPPSWMLLFIAAICLLASVGTPVPPRNSRRLFLTLAAVPTAVALFLTGRSLGPDPWLFYRHPDQVELRTSGGVLVGIALAVVAAVLLTAGRRAWAAAFAVNAVPWLFLYYSSRLTHSTFLLSAPVVIGVVVAAMLTGLSAVIVSRRT
ncbi:hypothetical protein [Kribbella sp. HUAS MG21]|uniref:Integral membrane protein n=1 Tax=Kribbella sp. HUAS MG21 TaxID=3160966 RepID=A0AAU7T4I4_9ACTN